MGTLIFAYIRRLGSFFGFKILNFNVFLRVFRKMIFFFFFFFGGGGGGGYEDRVDIFVCGGGGVITKLDYI